MCLHRPSEGEFVIVERGVVVGGLMICGSFLLAAMLNRSAMEERHAVPVAPIETAVPASVQPAVAPVASDCNEARAHADAPASAVGVEPSRSGLMVNGREPCAR